MTTFAKTTDGLIHVVFSDNCYSGKHFETMDLIPESQWENDHGKYDPEYICCNSYKYSEIVITDTNLSLVRGRPISSL
jgi:hypothetical protein